MSKKKDPQALPEGLVPKHTSTKGAIVYRVTDATTKRAGVVRLDKSDMTFYAELGEGESYHAVEGKDGRKVKGWLEEQLAKTTANERLEWIPVVRVSDTSDETRYYSRSDSDTSAACSVTISRMYLALTKDRTEWRELPWDACADNSPGRIEEDDRFVTSKRFRDGPARAEANTYHAHHDRPFTLPYVEDKTTFMRYTPDLWRGLRGVVQTIKNSRKAMRELLTTTEGMATIAAVGKGTIRLQLHSGDVPADK